MFVTTSTVTYSYAISQSPGVKAKVGGDHIETARSKRWGDFASSEGEDRLRCMKRSHELPFLRQTAKLHQPSNQVELTCKSCNWGFRRSTEPSAMRLFAATICRKAMSLCAKENQKSFEQKSNIASIAILRNCRPEDQIIKSGYSRATIRPSSFTCMAAWHRPCKARPRRSPRGMLGYVTNRFKRGNETQWKLKPARSDGWVMLSPSASDLYVILIIFDPWISKSSVHAICFCLQIAWTTKALGDQVAQSSSVH